MNSFWKFLVVLKLLTISLAAIGSPTLIGDQVDIQLSGKGSGLYSQVLVTNFPEVDPFGNTNYSIDIKDTAITFTVVNGGFCGFYCTPGELIIRVSELDWIGFPNATLVAATLTNIGGGDGFGLSFGIDFVEFKIADASQSRGEQVFVSLVVNEGSSIPEPSPIALAGLAVAVISVSRRGNNRCYLARST